jgi:adenylate cyclase
LGRFLSKYGARILSLILVLLSLAQIEGVVPSTLVDRVDDIIYDARLNVQRPVLDPRIVIVDIDEKSLSQFGRWPWSRDVVADLVTSLCDKYKVKTIGFDVVFAEPDTSSGYGTLSALAKNELKDIPQFGVRLKALKHRLDFDERLAKALQGRPVVLGYVFSNEVDAFEKGLLPPPVFGADELDGRRLDATNYIAYSANLPELQRAAGVGGFFNPWPDNDGVIRRVPLLAKFKDGYYESLSLATARLAMGATAVRPVFLNADAINSDEYYKEYGAIESIKINTMPSVTTIPVERLLSVLIPFHGPGGPQGNSYRYISAADVLNHTLPQADLADKIVLVGTTVAGLKDLRTAPVGVNYPGVEMHANVISAILDGNFKTRPDTSIAFEFIQILLIGAILIFVLPKLSPAFSMLFIVAVTLVVGGFNFWMYQEMDQVLPAATALLLIFSVFIVNIAWGYLFEYRKGRAVANLFKEYLAPELVAEMIENPVGYSMEGDSRELSVLFVDVRGFTTISEGLTPNALREYVNIYLTAMSENIQGNRGTLDKYIGDAVMAFWGAPVALVDHAARAVATALLMQTTAKALNLDFVARGWPPLKIGVGVNTGEMRVGDMGSKVRRAYTVMGDAVNLSARLEGITKVYGAGVVVGEATKIAAPAFAYRELDLVKVKGKNEPVPIFEPIMLDTELDDDMRAAIAQWHEALALFRSQKWDEAERIMHALLEINPDDGLCALYLQRIAEFREHPPGENWDGVTTFATK